MNPFENIETGKGLLKDKNNLFFGRYRLNFNQVIPFREFSFNRVFIKVNKEDVECVKNIYQSFPQHLKYEIQLYNQGKIRNNKSIQIDCFRDEDWFLCLHMMGDVVFIPMYNYYFALKSLSNYLEDCHFFIYSSSDSDDRWLDEYQIVKGDLRLSRKVLETEAFFGVIIYYLKEAIKLNTFEFKRFAAFHLYDLLFEDKYCYRKLREDGIEYNEYGEEITDDIQEYIQMMSVQELSAIKELLKVLFNVSLDNNIKNELNNIFAFNLLDYKRVVTKNKRH